MGNGGSQGSWPCEQGEEDKARVKRSKEGLGGVEVEGRNGDQAVQTRGVARRRRERWRRVGQKGVRTVFLKRSRHRGGGRMRPHRGNSDEKSQTRKETKTRCR